MVSDADPHRASITPAGHATGLLWKVALEEGIRWPTRRPWRLLAAVGAVTESIAHIPVTQEHLSEAPYIGVGFVLLTIAGLVLALLLPEHDTDQVWVMTGVVAGLALTGLVLSRTIGLPQIHDDIGNWTGPLAIVAAVGEVIMLVALRLRLLDRPTRP